MDALQDKGLTWHRKWENPLLSFEDCGIPSMALPLGEGASSSLCLRTQLGARCPVLNGWVTDRMAELLHSLRDSGIHWLEGRKEGPAVHLFLLLFYYK
ncbi:hypothetical protein DV515_00015241 [Chloebia gouldiae]|uniref:Uncharacterized protein n=1 Tax=Chloebia gouldiae TaxID=44316 RepID=A0A3L8RW17_CHLGU|nr:hypothetical protein DV515_00015241 [Chloebia gouldiae]